MEKVYCRVAGTCHIAENIDPNIYNVLKQGEKGASLLPVEVTKAKMDRTQVGSCNLEGSSAG